MTIINEQLHGLDGAERRDPLAALCDVLHDPERDASPWTPPLGVAITMARQALDKYAGASIHSHGQMLNAASGLHFVLRDLLAALDQEGAL